jgi:hypothetical protein
MKTKNLCLNLCLAVVLMLLGATAATAQTAVKNPTLVTFTVSADHALVASYELDIVRVSDNAVVQTLNVGKPAPDATGTASVSINVQPIAFGGYYGVMRAVASGFSSPNSAASNAFERTPGSPSRVAF